MFQRRHYEEVARIIRNLDPHREYDQREIARIFADRLSGNINRPRFLDACGALYDEEREE